MSFLSSTLSTLSTLSSTFSQVPSSVKDKKKKELAKKRAQKLNSLMEKRGTRYNSRMKAERQMDELLGYPKPPMNPRFVSL
jgi:hypothetical protein